MKRDGQLPQQPEDQKVGRVKYVGRPLFHGTPGSVAAEHTDGAQADEQKGHITGDDFGVTQEREHPLQGPVKYAL